MENFHQPSFDAGVLAGKNETKNLIKGSAEGALRMVNFKTMSHFLSVEAYYEYRAKTLYEALKKISEI